MNRNRLYQVVLAPRITEKSTRVGEAGNQYVFRVVPDANKSEVRSAVEVGVAVRIGVCDSVAVALDEAV